MVFLFQDSKSKADLLNEQFRSVFTRENSSEPLPQMYKPTYPHIDDIIIDKHGVKKLLQNLKVNKASGPTIFRT